jgi:predicted naringenin-chalcone synthase
MLFGDGCGAIVVGAGLRSYESPAFEFLRSASCVIPDTLDLMGWELGMDGWKVTLSPEITKHLGATITDFADSITETTLGKKVPYADMAWPIHPGGMAIIEAIEMTCKLDSDVHTRSTREVLRRVGNMSSGTVYFVLEDLLKRKTDKEYALMVSFGPGLTTEGNLLRVCPNASTRRDVAVPVPLPSSVLQRFAQGHQTASPAGNPFILGIGTANPEGVMKPVDVAEKMIAFYGDRLPDKDAKRLRRVAKTAGIDQRHSVIPVEVRTYVSNE